MTEVPYIRHLLTSEGIKPDPKKVEAVQKMPQPTDVSSVKRFLGMVSHVSKFLPNISSNTEPLRQLKTKGVEWQWSDNQQKAFDEVKTLITCHPVLQHYDVTKEVTLRCDASQSGVGAALLQEGHFSSIYIPRSHLYREKQRSNRKGVFSHSACLRSF